MTDFCLVCFVDPSGSKKKKRVLKVARVISDAHLCFTAGTLKRQISAMTGITVTNISSRDICASSGTKTVKERKERLEVVKVFCFSLEYH